MAISTIIALSTPPGESAIALLRLSGPECGAIAAACLGKAPTPRVATFARIKNKAGQTLDECVLTYFAKGKSYTGEAMLEVSCHGNPLIINNLLHFFVQEHGCSLAEPGEFTRRAFLNGTLDLAQAEGVADLIRARSDAALNAAHQQLGGALSARILQLRENLLGLMAQIEAYIDFPEDDLPPEEMQPIVQGLAAFSNECTALAATSAAHRRLFNLPQFVLCGAPNAGKSSLLNQLLGEDRALVSPEAGTTRDFVRETLTLKAENGSEGPSNLTHTLTLTDTAGLRAGGGHVEQAGQHKTQQQLATADCIVWLLDASEPFPGMPEALQNLAHTLQNEGSSANASETALAQVPYLHILLNKSDKPPHADFKNPEKTLQTIGAEELAIFKSVEVKGVNAAAGTTHFTHLSAATGEGLPALKSALAATAQALTTAGTQTAGLMVNARHAQALTSAAASVSAAGAKLNGQEPVELAASDIRAAADALATLTGRLDVEDMLDHLFGSFCIGK